MGNNVLDEQFKPQRRGPVRCREKLRGLIKAYSLLGTGAAVDRIFLMDLPRVGLSCYKLVIFGNTC